MPSSQVQALLSTLLLLATPGCIDAPIPETGCGAPATALHEIQGPGPRSPVEGQRRVVEAVVTARFPGPDGLGGYFLQEEAADEDDDPSTSEGLFVWEGDAISDLSVGDRVRLSGEVREFEGGNPGAPLTELVEPRDVTLCGQGRVAPPLEIALPLGAAADWEQWEGMRVTLSGVVTGTREWARFGTLELAHERLAAPTQVAAPGADARERGAADDRGRIRIDDGSTRTRPPLPGPLRAGDGVQLTAGIVDQRFGEYRVQPAEPYTIEHANPRSDDPPAVGGRLRIAVWNVRNWFHTLDDGPARCGPGANRDCRGARTPEERARQRARLGAALRGLDPDVAALVEIENGPPQALAALRAELGDGYEMLETGPLGSDVIRVALLFRSDRVRPAGRFAVLDRDADAGFDDTRHRPSLAQTFEERVSGERFTIVVNHWKSKSRACAGDPDTGDGQGDCSATRTAAARALVRWLATDPTAADDTDLLIVGDLNAYTREDPIRVLVDAGYTNLLARAEGPRSYTSTFDARFGVLDHAFASPSLASQVTGARVWHINADEPVDLPDADGPWGSSDHDPLLVGLALDGRSLPVVGGRSRAASPADSPPDLTPRRRGGAALLRGRGVRRPGGEFGRPGSGANDRPPQRSGPPRFPDLHRRPPGATG